MAPNQSKANTDPGDGGLSIGSRLQKRNRRLLSVLLFTGFIILSVIIYFGNLQFTSTGDTVPNSLVPFSLLLHHDIFLNRYLTQLNLSETYFVRPFQNGYISVYPIGAAITAVPFYLLFLLLGGHANFTDGILVAKMAAAIIAVISAVIVYRILLRMGISRKLSVVFMLLYAFGTETFAISSQGLWQHGPAELWISIFLYMAVKLYQGDTFKVWHSLMAGLAIGMLLLTRPQDTIVIFPFLVLLFSKRRRKYVLYAVPAVLVFAVVWLLYNYHFFSTPTHYGGAAGITGRLNSSFITGLLGNLINPSRGLFVFVPWSLVALWWFSKIRYKSFWKQIYAPVLVAIILYVFLYSKLSYWPAGACYGPRYMTDISPLLTMLSAAAVHFLLGMKKSVTTRVAKVVFGIFAVWSIAVQALGVYVPGRDWNYAVLSDTFGTGLWSVKYGEIAYYAKTFIDSEKPLGPIIQPQVSFQYIHLLDKPNIHTPGTSISTFLPGKRYAGTALIQNVGSQTWPAIPAHQSQRMISVQITAWKNGHELKAETTNGILLHSVQPGDSIVVNFYFWTPPTPGDYIYRFQVVQGTSKSQPAATQENSTKMVVHVRNS